MPTNVMLANPYKGTDVIGWYMSEKLDGVRAVWDGYSLKSRNNKPIYAPQWFTSMLPIGVILDGELHTKRGDFQNIVSIVRKKVPINLEWINITFKVFDTIREGIFADRYSYLLALEGNYIYSILPQYEVLSSAALDEYYNHMLSVGAEGLIIKNPTSVYEFRRSPNLLKLKPSNDDEATVFAHQPGEGKYVGMMGAIICKWRNRIITIGTGFNDAQRIDPPPLGSTIIFKYQHLTDDGMPRFPVFISDRNYE